MKLRNKLYVGFGAMLTVTFLLLLLSMSMMNMLNQKLSKVVSNDFRNVKASSDLQYEVIHIGKGLDHLLLDLDQNNINANIELVRNSHLQTYLLVDSLSKTVKDEHAKSITNQLFHKLSAYQEIEFKMINLVKAGDKSGASRVFVEEAQHISNDIIQTIESLKKHLEASLEQSLQTFTDNYHFAIKIMIFLLAAGIISGTVITLWVIQSIALSLRKLQQGITRLAYENTDQLPRIQADANDEIGKIAMAFNNMADALEKHSKHEKEYKQALEDYSWLKSSIAEISTMYQGVQDLRTLARQFISKIAPMVGANYGIFYIREDQDGLTRLSKLAAYAYCSQEVGRSEFKIGEGLVGQCAQENKTILIANVPDDYIKITSGVGASTPKQLMLLPVEYEGQVLAVIEIASLEPMSVLQQSLLTEVLSNLGITINSIAGHMKVQKLLSESQSLTEELQSQSEELQLQQAELKSINEKLEEQYRNSEQKSRELEKIKEELEEKARQVEISSKYKSEFLANMSHELRTPLNSLLILAQTLAENTDGNLTAKQVDFVQTIHASGQDLLSMINDILDLSKIESGKMDVHPGQVNLTDIRIFAERHFEPIARNKNITFEVKLDANLPKFIETDEQRLQQILQNLLANAFKFTNEGSVQLFISMPDTHCRPDLPDFLQEKEIIAFAVKDTGIGVPKEKQQLIFEAFQQADGTTSRKYGGTGLGLSISRELAQLIRGYIDIESEEGYGSTFTLYLPFIFPQKQGEPANNGLKETAATLSTNLAAMPQPDAVHIPPSNENDARRGRKGDRRFEDKSVLIIDQDMRNVFALTTTLENHNMKVLFAENGQDGIELLRKGALPDLVLMDITEPETNSYDILRSIRDMPECASIPIIALTAKTMSNDKDICIAAGASDYICKPVNMEQLFSLMRVWLYR